MRQSLTGLSEITPAPFEPLAATPPPPWETGTKTNAVPREPLVGNVTLARLARLVRPAGSGDRGVLFKQLCTELVLGAPVSFTL
ncbi:hypothetical protein J6590_004672 [Homalodisca vitripennis]|nr:hypothetical protein J6590_004672 [Homalodisca vitripennis]